MRAKLRSAALLAAGAMVVGACESDRVVGPTAERPSRSLAAAPTALMRRPVGYWTTKAPMPKAVAYPASAVVNGILYTLGGYWDDALSTRNPAESFAYDPASDSWTKRSAMPHPRSEAAAAVINGLIYVAGGWSLVRNAPETAVDVYDPSTDTWTYHTKLPTYRVAPAVAAVNGILYVMGGW